MQLSLSSPRAERSLQGIVGAGLTLAGVAVMAGSAMAGTDATFDTAVTTVAGYINGSAGKLAALVSLAYGVVRMATSGWSLGHVGVPMAVGVAAGIGGPIVQSSVSAII
jgi:hypothetical protein